MKKYNLDLINSNFKGGAPLLTQLSDEDFENNYQEIINQVFAELFLI